MPRTHGANNSILFAQILDPYEVISEGFVQINDVLFAHVYKALTRRKKKLTGRSDFSIFLVVQTSLDIPYLRTSSMSHLNQRTWNGS